MVSFRKKYLNENGADKKDAPPVASTPVAAAQLPPVADAPKPAEPKDEPNPVEKAASSALKARLAEMKQAENVSREVEQQPQAAACD